MEESTVSDFQQLAGKVLSILRYRRWLFVLPLLAGMLVSLVGSLWVPRKYSMKTVFERRDDPVMSKLVANSPYNLENLKNSLRFSLIGPNAVGNALAQIEGCPTDALTPKVAQFASALSVALLDSRSDFDLIQLSYIGDWPELGEKLLPVLRDNYVRRAQASIVDLQRQAQKFFATEAETRRLAVARFDTELAQLLMQQPEVDPTRPDWLNQRLLDENHTVERLNLQKTELTGEIHIREQQLVRLDEQQKQGKPPSVETTQKVNNPELVQLESEIVSVKREIADAKTAKHMLDTHPRVMELNSKLNQLQTELEKLPIEIVASSADGAVATNPWDQKRNEIAPELTAYRLKLEQVTRDLTRHQTALVRLENDKNTVLERQQNYLLRKSELDNLKSELNGYQRRLEDINQAMTASNTNHGTRFSIVEECRRPATPTTPKLSGTFMLSGGVGLGLGIVVVFLRELFDRSCRNPARVQQLMGIPVLETIGEITVGRNCKRAIALIAGRTLVGIQVALILAFAGLNYLSLECPSTYARWAGSLSTKLTAVAGMVHW